MIDKADFRVIEGTRPTKEFQEIISASEVFDGTRRKVWKKTKGYRRSGDFTEYGLPVLVHFDCEMTKRKNHKVEILQTGEKTYSQIVELGSRLFEGEPQNWGLLRADLTADVDGVPMQWFKEHVYIAGKQTLREIGEVEAAPYMTLRKGRAETLYAGVKPNQIRIYDKVGERRARYSRMIRRHVNEARAILAADTLVTIPVFPTFQEVFGHEPDAIITRVERQVAARDLEKLGLHTMFSLKCRAPDLSPFQKLRFFAQPDDDLSIETWGLKKHLIGMGIQQHIRDYGIADTRKWMQQHLGRHFDRDWKQYRPFMNVAARSVGITAANLQGAYEASTKQQIAA